MGRRVKGEGSFVQRKDGRWMGRVTVNGEVKTFIGADKEEVFQKWTNAKNDLANGEYTEPSKLSFGEWIQEWLVVYKKRAVKAKTFYTYTVVYNNYIRDTKLASVKLSKLRHSHIQSFVNKMVDDGYSEATAKLVVALITGSLTKAAHPTIGLIKRSPADGIEWPRFDKAKRCNNESVKAFTREQQKAFVEACNGARLGDTFLLMLYTGMRPGEAMGLTWADVDEKKGTIKVTGNRQMIGTVGDDLKVTGYEMLDQDEAKSDAGTRTIPMSPQAKAVLARMKGLNTKFVCTDIDQQPPNPNDIKNAIKAIERAAKVPELSPHKLRHTFATRCLESGMKPKTLQKILGHTTLAMTMDIYAHVMEEDMEQDMAKVSVAFD